MLAEVPERSVVQSICANCHFKFQIIHGRVTENALARQQQSSRRSEVYRDYELQLALSQELEIVRISLHERDKPLAVRRDDDVIVVSTVRGSEPEELLYIQNVTTDSVLRLDWPGARANRRATNAAVFVFVVVSLPP